MIVLSASKGQVMKRCLLRAERPISRGKSFRKGESMESFEISADDPEEFPPPEKPREDPDLETFLLTASELEARHRAKCRAQTEL